MWYHFSWLCSLHPFPLISKQLLAYPSKFLKLILYLNNYENKNNQYSWLENIDIILCHQIAVKQCHPMTVSNLYLSCHLVNCPTHCLDTLRFSFFLCIIEKWQYYCIYKMMHCMEILKHCQLLITKIMIKRILFCLSREM